MAPSTTKIITIDRFDGGMADDASIPAVGEFGASKGFDILTYPQRLSPVPTGVTADSNGYGIINVIIGGDGAMYGAGVDGSGYATFYKKASFSSAWAAVGAGDTGVAGDTNSRLFLWYAGSGTVRKIIYQQGTTAINILDPSTSTGAGANNVTFTTIGCNGFVHPQTNFAYVAYDNLIGAFENSETFSQAVLTIPSAYLITALGSYGNYLAIGCSPVSGGVPQLSSKVFLWDMQSPLWNSTLEWGAGGIEFLSELNGILIGITQTTVSGEELTHNSIQIKAYSGGAVTLIKEISTVKQTTTVPDVKVNANVNFVYKNRLYFSISVVGGGNSPAYYGLWSIGRNKLTNRWTVINERFATADDSETNVLAAAFFGNYLQCIHTAAGTGTITVNNSAYATLYAGSSYYESGMNPQMPVADRFKKKKLEGFAIDCLPLTSSGQIVAKYRVDTNAAAGSGGGNWITMFTKTSTSPTMDLCRYETTLDASGNFFTDGTNYEFRIESSGGAEILGFMYKYDVLSRNL